MRRAALPAALLAVGLGFALSACSGGDEPEADATPTSVQVSDAELGEALDALVFPGAQGDAVDGGGCLVDAVREAGMSEESLAEIVDLSGDDQGAVIDSLREDFSDDAAILLSPGLRAEFDACVDAAVLPKGADAEAEKTSYEAPAKPPAHEEGKPSLKPTIDLKYQSVDLASQLEPGLKVVLTSFAIDEKQEKVYTEAAGCMAGVIIDADMSEEAREFLASGPKIGTGSIAEHLPEADREIWESPSFVGQMNDCTTSVDESGHEEDDEEE